MPGTIIAFDMSLIQTLGFQFLNTAILCIALTYLLYKPVLKFMNDRSQKINNQISNAAERLSESEKLKAEYTKKLADIDKERAEILESARKRGQEREAQIIAEAQNEVQTLRERARLEIQREQEKAKDEMKREIIEVSTMLASQYISKAIDETTQKKLLDEAINGLGDVKWLS